MTARPNYTFRGDRRRIAKQAKLVWRALQGANVSGQSCRPGETVWVQLPRNLARTTPSV